MKTKPNYCSLCPPGASIALRVVGSKFYCENHKAEAYAEARRVTSGRKDDRLSRGEWLKINFLKKNAPAQTEA